MSPPPPGERKYMNMKLLEEMDSEAAYSAAGAKTRVAPRSKVRHILDTTKERSSPRGARRARYAGGPIHQAQIGSESGTTPLQDSSSSRRTR